MLMAKKKPPAKFDWDEALHDDLQDALSDYKQLPLLGQIRTLLALADYLRWRVPGELLEPLENIYTRLMNEADAHTFEQRHGPRPAPLSERIVEGRAAATVTVLKGCGWRVGDAIKKVAEVTGLDENRLRYFRDEIHRGRANELVRKVYETHVKDFSRLEQMSRDEVASYVLDVCAKYYAPGRPFRRHFDL
jgi:hypothetical protein